MTFARIGLLALILGFGGVVETAWRVREGRPLPLSVVIAGWRPEGPAFTFPEERTLQLAPATEVTIANAYGDVRVLPGEPGAVRAVLRREAHGRDEAMARPRAEAFHLVTRVEGTVLRVTTNREDVERSVARLVSTHLDLTLPPGVRVRVDDDHGDIAVEGMGAVEARTSFGDVRVERAAGDVTVRAHHGSATALGVQGALGMEVRHGDALVRDVGGTVALDVEHGDMEIQGVGPLTVAAAFASLSATTVRGDLVMQGPHTGVRAEDVQGGATVEAEFDDVQLAHVKGDVVVQASHAEVELADVGGGARVVTDFDGVVLTRVQGLVDVRVDHGPLTAKALGGETRIHATGDDVEVDGFQGPLQLDAERAAISLTAAVPLRGPITARTSHQDLELHLPAGADLDLEAEADRGDVEVDVPGFAAASTAPGHVRGRVGAGGVSVRLNSSFGTVRVVGSGE